jgi:hypothetical protein
VSGATLKVMRGRQICACSQSNPFSSVVVFEPLPRLCAMKEVKLLLPDISARSRAAEPSPENDSSYRHNSDGVLQFLRHKLEQHLRTAGTGYRIGT